MSVDLALVPDSPPAEVVVRRARIGRKVKRLIVFDLDGTLAESKSALDAEMGALLHDLLGVVKVAVISGGD